MVFTSDSGGEMVLDIKAEDNASEAIGGVTNKLGGMQKAAGLAGVALGGIGIGGLGAATDAAADFDAAMNESLAIMGDVSDEMEENMAETARTVAEETTFSSEEAAESYFYLASAGLDAAESMEKLPEVAEFAQAGNFNMAEATDILTDAQSALGDETLELADLSDMLVQANTDANATVEQFGQSLTNKAAPAMQRLGIDTKEGISALQVFADQGLKGNRAGTILARTLEGLSKRARNNKEEFEELGVSVFDSDGNMRSMQAIISDLEGSMEGMSTKQKQAALEQLGFNKRAQQGIDLLMGNSEAMEEYAGNLEESGGTAGEVADNQLDSLSAQWDLLKSRINDIAIEIGGALIPSLMDIVSFVGPLIDTFAAFNEKTDGMAGVAVLAGTALAGIATVIGVVGPAIATTLVPAIGGLVAALSGLLLPIAAVVAAVAGLWYAWDNNIGGIRDVVGNFVDTIFQSFEDVEGSTRRLGSTVDEIFSKAEVAIELFKDAVTFIFQTLIVPTLKKLRELWELHFASIVESVVKTMNAIWDKIKWALSIIMDFWKSHGEEIMSVVMTVFDAVRGFVVTAMDAIMSAIQVVLAIIRLDFDEALGVIWGFIKRTFDRIVDFISGGFLEGLQAALKLVFDFVKNIFEAIFDFLIGNSIVRDMFNAIIDFITVDFFGAFKDIFGKIFDFIKSIFRKVFNFYTDIWGDIFEAGSDVLGDILGGVKDTFGGILGFIKDTFTTVASWITDTAAGTIEAAFTTLTDAVAAVWNGLKETIGDVLGGIYDMTVGKIEDAVDFVTETFNSIVPDRIEIPPIDIPPGDINLPRVEHHFGWPIDETIGFGGDTIAEQGSLISSGTWGFDMPQLAQGGIAMDRTLAEIGEGGQPEAIIPLDKLERMLTPDVSTRGRRSIDVRLSVEGDDELARMIRDNAEVVVEESEQSKKDRLRRL